MIDNVTIADRIKWEMEYANLRVVDIASKLGIARESASRIIGGKQKPSDKIIRKLAVIFGVTEDYLLCKTDIRENVYVTEEVLPVNNQDAKLNTFLFFASNMGVRAKLYVRIKDAVFRFDDGFNCWFNELEIYQDSNFIGPREYSNKEIIIMLQNNYGASDLYFMVEYKGKKEKYGYREFYEKLLKIMAMIEQFFNIEFEVQSFVNYKLYEDNLLMAYEGSHVYDEEDSVAEVKFDKTMDLFFYFDEVGVDGCIIHKDGTVDIKYWEFLDDRQKDRIVTVLTKDGKGLNKRKDGKLIYNKENHVPDKVISTEENHKEIRSYMVEAEKRSNMK